MFCFGEDLLAQDSMVSELSKSSHVVMIDNYDSFTWNLYEYLCQAGAKVSVYRNDEIKVEDIANLSPKPTCILISPGPGHPSTDAGISRACIEYYKGKLPIFGVCMGQQCIYEVFGGKVEFAGEIIHGKTSIINHDNKGMFLNVPQGVAVTRYHSLAGSKISLPDELEITAKTDNGIIMGVRHKTYAIEGVQFHPESILTEEGHLMMENILKIRGGYWKDNIDTANKNDKPSILAKIYDKRSEDLNSEKLLPGRSFKDLEIYYDLGIAPKVINFYDKLNSLISENKIAIISEIKRASPSKGNIDIEANAGIQAKRYSEAGVAGISVLTEPNWFKGSLKDLEIARKAIEFMGDNRPCVLRKEFIFDKYQILEARLSGADTVLLIVKMLEKEKLIELIEYSRSLNLEPLIEVNTTDELQIAISVGSKVIGINNRDLTNFQVNLNTTTDLIASINSNKKDILFLALSGINGVDDIRKYVSFGVYGFLIGEALMRQGAQVGEFIQQLQSI